MDDRRIKQLMADVGYIRVAAEFVQNILRLVVVTFGAFLAGPWFGIDPFLAVRYVFVVGAAISLTLLAVAKFHHVGMELRDPERYDELDRPA